MLIIGLADIHGDLGMLPRLAAELAAADLVLLIGDITRFGRPEGIDAVVTAVAAYNPRLLGVPGNCDSPGVDASLVARDIDLDGRGRVIDGIGFIGVGGSLPCPG